MLLRFPTLLNYSYEAKMAPALARLQDLLKLGDVELRQVVCRQPAVLGYSHEDNVAPKLARLQRELGLSADELRAVVVAQPNCLGLSFERNVAPKLRFLRSTAGLSEEELRERVLKRPSLLAYSLAGRLRPRITEAHRLDIKSIDVLIRITMTDAEFERYLSSVVREQRTLQRLADERFAMWTGDSQAVAAMLAESRKPAER